MISSDIRKIVGRVPLFDDLAAADIDGLVSRAHIWTYASDTLVFGEGEAGESVFIVLEGQVKVFVSGRCGREVILGFQGPGDYFGEVALIDRAPRSASVMTTTVSRFLVVGRESFCDFMAAHPGIAGRIIRALAGRVRDLTDRVRCFAVADVRRRVVAALLRLAEPAGAEWVVRVRPSYQCLADMAGASREMTGRVVRDLVAEGVVVIRGTEMRIVSGRIPEDLPTVASRL